MRVRSLICAWRLSVMLVMLFWGQHAIANDGHRVEISLWIAGEPYESETFVELSDGMGTLEVPNSHLLEFSIEPINDVAAPQGSVWLTVGVSTWDASDQSWQHVTDTLLGAPMGQQQVLSLTQPDSEPTPEQSDVYLVATVHPNSK